MSSATGGRGDKLGNRYEGLWVAYLLVRVVAEELLSVQLEGVGDEEVGVDVWVTHPNGQRQAYQCKRKNRTLGRWTVHELVAQDVVRKMGDQLKRIADARFTFVSAHPAAELRELADAARGSGDDAETFFTTTLGVKTHASNLDRLCVAFGVDSTSPAGRRQGFDLLRRIDTHLFEDSPEGRGWVRTLTRCYLDGNPDTAVEVLANFAQDRMGTAITADAIRHLLRERGIGVRRLVGDRSVAERLDRLRAEFRDSLQPSLIQAALVPRSETDRVLEQIRKSDSGRLVLVHGRAGGGKSCVLLQLSRALEAEGIPYLPIRFDRRPPQVSALRFGTATCDLPDSPGVTLHAHHPEHLTVLILDQLDAVRWTTSHASAQWEACQEVMDEALALPNVVVVVACRTFDLRDDQQISGWQARRKGTEVEVGDLTDTAVESVVQAGGGTYAALTERQKTLLRSPLLLSLWTQVMRATAHSPAFTTHADLMRAFWQTRFDLLARQGFNTAECDAAVTTIVTAMDQAGTLSAPARLLDPYPLLAPALQSLQVLSVSGRRLAFVHQSYFEYRLAVHLLDRMADGTQTLTDWVQTGDQSLLRREQLRLVFTLLRDEQPAEYVRTVHDLVTAPAGAVRFHLKQLVLRVVGEFPDPSDTERDLVYRLSGSESLRVHLFDQVFARQPAWFDAMADRGLLTAWLGSDDERLVDLAVQFCRWWSSRCGDRIAALLEPFREREAPWPLRVAVTLPFNPVEDSDRLFALRIELLRSGTGRALYLIDQKLAESRPDRVVELVDALFDYRRVNPAAAESEPRDERGSPFVFPRHEAEHLEMVAQAVPELLWGRCVPRMIDAVEPALDREHPDSQTGFLDDDVWPDGDRRNWFGHGISLPEIVATAGALVAGCSPDSFATDFGSLIEHPSLTLQFVTGLTFAKAERSVAEVAIRWLCRVPRRLSLGDEYGREWGLARRVIERHAAACSIEAYRLLEQTILGYRSSHEGRSVEWQRHSRREYNAVVMNRMGEAQHALLASLPEVRLSDRARSERGVLDHKFGGRAKPVGTAREDRFRSLVPPMGKERVSRISDAGWLRIMGATEITHSPRRQRNVGDRHFSHLTPDAYARLLGDAAELDPRRFAGLAVRIPAAASPEYLWAVLSALRHTDRPNTASDNWVAATDAQVSAVVEHVGYRGDGETGRRVCDLLRSRRAGHGTTWRVPLLGRYATEHPDPAPNERRVHRKDGKVEYGTEAMNCTRGVALWAITDELFHAPDLFAEYLPVIRAAVSDPAPAVRVAAAGACLPVWNHDRGLAVELFLAATDTADEALDSFQVIEFIRYAVWSHYPQLEPLLTRMANSPLPEVATKGTMWITIGWLTDRTARTAHVPYLTGNAPQRAGVATAAAHNCDDPRASDRCASILTQLVDDPDESVLDAVSVFLRQEGVLRIPALCDLAIRYVNGPCFAKHPVWLVEAIRNHPDSLIPLAAVFSAVCARLSTDLNALTRDGRNSNSFELTRFIPSLLRFYEQAEQVNNLTLRGRCLDWWDRLIESRTPGALNLMASLDTGTHPFG